MIQSSLNQRVVSTVCISLSANSCWSDKTNLSYFLLLADYIVFSLLLCCISSTWFPTVANWKLLSANITPSPLHLTCRHFGCFSMFLFSCFFLFLLFLYTTHFRYRELCSVFISFQIVTRFILTHILYYVSFLLLLLFVEKSRVLWPPYQFMCIIGIVWRRFSFRAPSFFASTCLIVQLKDKTFLMIQKTLSSWQTVASHLSFQLICSS